MTTLFTFPVTVTKFPRRSKLREEGPFPLWYGGHEGKSGRQLSHCIYRQEVGPDSFPSARLHLLKVFWCFRSVQTRVPMGAFLVTESS